METGIRPPGIQPAGFPEARTRGASRAPLSGWQGFDALGLVRPGRVLLLDLGCVAAARVVDGLLVGAVEQGRDALVVDGGNTLDVYHLGDAARRRGLRREHVLQSVRVARGFTAYQLQSLLEDGLPDMLARNDIGLAIAASLPEMYLDEDLARSEARILVTRALRTLREAARRHDVPIVVTNTTLAPGERHKLRATLDEGVDDAAALLPPGGARAALTPDALRVLARGRAHATLDPGPRARQRLLGDFEPHDAPHTSGFYRRAIDARIRYAPKRAGELRQQQRERSHTLLSAHAASPPSDEATKGTKTQGWRRIVAVGTPAGGA